MNNDFCRPEAWPQVFGVQICASGFIPDRMVAYYAPFIATILYIPSVNLETALHDQILIVQYSTRAAMIRIDKFVLE